MRLGKLFCVALGALVVMVTLTVAGELATMEELERRIDSLAREVEAKRIGFTVIDPDESTYGLGPAASKVYQAEERRVSLGGYGEMLYEDFDGDRTDQADFLRAILYVGYKFNDKFVFNSEIELEHADEAFVEFAYLDYLHSEAFNIRAGLLLIPIGLINEYHEPTVFLSAKRPLVENKIIPTTWRENGVGIFGDLGPFSYKLYVVNSLDGGGFSADGLRGGRQKGSKAKANDFSYVGNIEFTPTPGFRVGGSAYYGDQGQDLDVDVSTTIYEGHVDWKWQGFDLRVLGVVAELDDVAELSRIIAAKGVEDGMPAPADADIDSVGERLVGWYAQLGYDLLSQVHDGEASLTPFVRIEAVNTQDETPAGFKPSDKYDEEVTTVGINFKPIDEVALKAEWQSFDQADDQFNVALGYVF